MNMNSLKVKLALVANIASLLMLIVLGSFSFYFSKDALFEKIMEAESSNLSAARVAMNTFVYSSSASIEALQKEILKFPDQDLSTESELIETISPLLKPFSLGGHFLAVYIGLPSGKAMVYDMKVSPGSHYRIFGGDGSYDASKRGWYQSAVAANKLFISEIYTDAITGLPCFTYAMPLYKNGKLVGVLGVDVLVSALQEQVKQLSGNIFIYDSSLSIFASTDQQLVMAKNPDIKVIDSLYKQHGSLNFFEYTSAVDLDTKIAVCDNVSAYTFCATTSSDGLNEPILNAMYVQILVVICMGFGSILVFYLVVSYYLSPLRLISDGLKDFFDYLNYKTQHMQVLNIKRKDELGMMAQVINHNIQNTQESLRKDSELVNEVVSIVEEAKEGRFGGRINQSSFNPQMEQLKHSLNEMSAVLANMLGHDLESAAKIFSAYEKNDFLYRIQDPTGFQVSVNNLGDSIAQMLRVSASFAHELQGKSQELDQMVQQLVQGANSQASSLQETAAAIEEITSSMQNVNMKTSEVISQSETIKNVIGIIRDIADQTNLLALNAAIEAARAGEHGRGFAVVADEVRQLAERTQKSLSEIEASANTLTQGIHDMADAIKEQTAGISQINDSVAQIESISQQNAEVAKQSQHISQAVDNVANAILDDVSQKRF